MMVKPVSCVPHSDDHGHVTCEPWPSMAIGSLARPGGASMGDNRISCGVHLFDDPKSGAPYVVPLPDTGVDIQHNIT